MRSLFRVFNPRSLNLVFLTSNSVEVSARGLVTSLHFCQRENWGTKKVHRHVKLRSTVMDPAVEALLAPMRALVKEQGDLLRSLKASGAPELDVKKAVLELKARKKVLEDEELRLAPAEKNFDRARMEDLLKRRFFYDQSFAIYGGATGQYDFGPVGCALKSNMIQLWRRMFVLEEQMLEVDCSILTPEPVLRASGHVERFADLMTKDAKSGECFRLDHLIKAHLEKASADPKAAPDFRATCQDIIVRLDGMTAAEMAEVMQRYDMKSPTTGNDLSPPIEFNLMFSTQIGPTGLIKGFLRPETAQGIFVNFKRLLEFNQGRLPFAAAQIGNSFRNEISPRSGLLRVREFTMCEIEHFCDSKDHPKFVDVRDTELLLYSALDQESGKSASMVKIGDAVDKGIVNNETLGYFMARIQAFLLCVGIRPGKVRFRQHMGNEMAHYACDCWDAECLSSYGWVECVGCADRSAYDLTQHAKATKVRLAAEKKLPEPKEVEIIEAMPQKAAIGKIFRQDAKTINEALASLTECEIAELQVALDSKVGYKLKADGREFVLSPDLISVRKTKKIMHVEEIVPSVIEPSFGVGRIMYCALEQNFKIRDEQRTYFSLPPMVAPIKCAVLPLSGAPELVALARQLSRQLTIQGVSHKVDDSSGSVGRRYARTDELGVPFAATVDFDSLKGPPSVTLRERDSMTQVRLEVESVAQVLTELGEGRSSWEEVQAKYPAFVQQESTAA